MSGKTTSKLKTNLDKKCFACGQVAAVVPEPVVAIPARVIAMLFIDGYFAEFWRTVQELECTHRVAWDACERELERYGLPGRYDSYPYFRKAKSTYYRKAKRRGR